MNKAAFAVLGLFDSAQQLLDAIPLVKGKVAGRLDAYTPYPIHGMEKALGLKKSPVGGMVLVMGMIGAISALAFELWASGMDYRIVTAGKPVLSWEAFVPIMFEVTVLFATFTSGLGMLLLLNRLPLFRHPMLRARSMPQITKDKFALAVESDGQLLDVDAILAVLGKAGARETEVIEQPAAPGPIAPGFIVGTLLAITLSCAVAGYLTYWAIKLFPVSIPMVHMLEQPRLDPQRESSFFPDGFGMRLPVAGTVARAHRPYPVKNEAEAKMLANPLPRNAAVLKDGQQAFMTFCSVCHGILGNGATSLTAAYGAKPANLTSQKFREYADGEIYHVIMTGKNAMPSYAADLTEDERWAVVHYVRALQRALNAKDEDIPKESAK
jgi:mono/diheme cytochrome c family protein